MIFMAFTIGNECKDFSHNEKTEDFPRFFYCDCIIMKGFQKLKKNALRDAVNVKTASLKTLIGGFSAGLVNGLLGAGGGMMAVPILQKIGLNRKEAHCNSVAVILPISLFSAILYLTSGKVQLSDALPFLPFGLIGSVIGTLLLRRFSGTVVRRIFGVLIVIAGVRLFMR